MYAEAFGLGLSTGMFCLGYCAPVLMGLMLSRDEAGFHGNAVSLSIFMGGRLMAYMLFGALSGLAGEFFASGSLVFSTALPIAEIILGGVMLGHSLGLHFPHWSVCHYVAGKTRGRSLMLVTGFLTGINVCPPFLLAVGAGLRTGSMLNGTLFFLLFFLATSLYMLPFLFTSLLSRFKDIRTAAKIVCGMTGAYFIYEGVSEIVQAGKGPIDLLVK
ncbi:sulfite exporter TauE/SafE family protein [Maridesulfovibrio sp.]|uniref:sulfite exporter TauE/SafE family protein n=1 Tax=Maridesulfovibrio sp. TaxID=2795000 RepID=UPI0039EF58D7